MGKIGNFFLAGAFALFYGATVARAQAVLVPLNNLGNQAEPGSGFAQVDLDRGTVSLNVRGLQPVPHDNPLGSGSILAYAAWLVNSERALGKLNIGFLFPTSGNAELNFSAPGGIPPESSASLILGIGADLSGQGFNMVVITAETVLNLTRPQPSGPPIAAGHIPGTPAPVTTTPPAVEVFMGDLTRDVFGFQEITITLFSGQSVRWTNVSPAFIPPHTATRTEAQDGTTFGGGQEFDSGPVPFGGSFIQTFTLPPGVPAGIFNYHCTPHSALGMTGRIVVVARPTTCTATLSGSEEVPPVTTSASGSATVQYTPLTGVIIYNLTTTGLSGVAAHIHQAPAGANGPIIVPFEGGPTQWSGQATLTPEQGQALLSGGTYANVHTSANPGGEIRGQLQCQ
jgi:plastocyanin